MALFQVQRRFMSSGLQKFCYNLAGFNKLGLMRDDTLYENADVKEALNRLPQDILDQRNFRLVRAMQLSIKSEILPKSEWTQLENDELYLQPFLKEVIKEREERESWDKDH